MKLQSQYFSLIDMNYYTFYVHIWRVKIAFPADSIWKGIKVKIDTLFCVDMKLDRITLTNKANYMSGVLNYIILDLMEENEELQILSPSNNEGSGLWI